MFESICSFDTDSISLNMQNLITPLIPNYSIIKKALYHIIIMKYERPYILLFQDRVKVDFLCYWHAVVLIYLLYGNWKILQANNQNRYIMSLCSISQNWEIREMLDLQICFSGGMVEFAAHWVVLLMIYHIFYTEVEMYFKTSTEITGFHIQRNCMRESHPCWNEQKLLFFLRQDCVCFLQPPHFWKCRRRYLQISEKN